MMHKQPFFMVSIGIYVMLAIGTLSNPAFVSVPNLYHIVLSCTRFGLIATGLTMLAIMGRCNLSTVATIGVAVSTVALLSSPQDSMGQTAIVVTAALLLAFVCGATLGIVTMLFSRLGLPVASLAASVVFNVGLGAIPGVVKDRLGFQSTLLSPSFQSIADPMLGVPAEFYAWVLTTLAAWLFVNRTAVGLRLQADGKANEDAHLSVALNWGSLLRLMIVFALSMCLAALAGIFLSARVGSAMASVSAGYTFAPYAAVFLGMSRGRFSIPGSMLGAILVTLIQNVLLLQGVVPALQESLYQLIVLGGLLMFFWRRGRLRLVKN